MNSLLDTIQGLPVHPLVVHFAVVLLPLATMSVIVAIYIPRFRKTYAFASVLGVFVGTGAAFVAKQSGEALSARIGLPKEHANYGNVLPILSAAFFILTLLWYRHWRTSRSNQVTILAHVAAVMGVGVLALTLITGHTGAQAVWKGRLVSDKSTTSSISNQGSSTKSYALSEVAQHKSSSSCWSAIDGNVYDLTKWINQHPGGSGVIKAICGKDGSAAFNGQHAGQNRPANELARFKIGALK